MGFMFFAFRVLCVLGLIAGAAFAEPVVIENFDELRAGARWERVRDSEIIENCGTGWSGNRCLRAEYKPTSRGSSPMVHREPIPRGDHYLLRYDVYFESDFEFVRGGKLPGLGSENPTTGCDKVDPDDWSVRLMWGPGGSLRNYIYSQDRDLRCGDGAETSQRVFHKERWHRVEVEVKLNAGPNSFDGFVIARVDGQVIVEDQGLRLRKNMGDDTDISRFMYSTFFGGSNRSWAPSKTVHARFDNFSVSRLRAPARELARANVLSAEESQDDEEDQREREEERRQAEQEEQEEERRQAEQEEREEERRQAEQEEREEERLLAERALAEELRLAEQERLLAARALEEERRLARQREQEEERRLAQQREQEEERRLVQQREQEEERRLAQQREQEEERRQAQQREQEEERRLAQQREQEEERRQAQQREQEEERRQAQQREQEEERRLAQQREQEEERRLAQQREQEEERRQAQRKEQLERREERAQVVETPEEPAQVAQSREEPAQVALAQPTPPQAVLEPLAPQLSVVSVESGIAGTILNDDFDSDLTTYTDRQWQRFKPMTVLADGFSESRATIVGVEGVDNALNVMFPHGTSGAKNSGMRWQVHLPNSEEQVILSYSIRFDAEFDFGSGGVLPGVGHATSQEGAAWRSFMTWDKNGYLGYVGRSGDGEQRNDLMWSGQRQMLEAGKTYEIKFAVSMNAQGPEVSPVEIWVNELQIGVLSKEEFLLGTTDVPLTDIYFDTYTLEPLNNDPSALSGQQVWIDDLLVTRFEL